MARVALGLLGAGQFGGRAKGITLDLPRAGGAEFGDDVGFLAARLTVSGAQRRPAAVGVDADDVDVRAATLRIFWILSLPNSAMTVIVG